MPFVSRIASTWPRTRRPGDVTREGLSWVWKRGSVHSRRLTSMRRACNTFRQKFFEDWSNPRFCWRWDHGTRIPYSRRI